MVTVTPGSTAPLVSVTRPLSSAVDSCADAEAAVRRSANAPRERFPRKRPIQPPWSPGGLKVRLYVNQSQTPMTTPDFRVYRSEFRVVARSLAAREKTVNGRGSTFILVLAQQVARATGRT